MPNGGLKPACLYCKHFAGRDGEERHCKLHDFKLGFTIAYLLCTDLTDPEGIDEWVSKDIDLKTLEPQKLYFWVETNYIDQQGNFDHAFNLNFFASIEDYKALSDEQEEERLRELHEQENERYRKMGYKIKRWDY